MGQVVLHGLLRQRATRATAAAAGSAAAAAWAAGRGIVAARRPRRRRLPPAPLTVLLPAAQRLHRGQRNVAAKTTKNELRGARALAHVKQAAQAGQVGGGLAPGLAPAAGPQLPHSQLHLLVVAPHAS